MKINLPFEIIGISYCHFNTLKHVTKGSETHRDRNKNDKVW